MNSIQREIENRGKEKVKGKEAADRMGYMLIYFVLIGLIIWGFSLVN